MVNHFYSIVVTPSHNIKIGVVSEILPLILELKCSKLFNWKDGNGQYQK